MRPVKITHSHLRTLSVVLWLGFALNVLAAWWASEFDDMSTLHATVAWVIVAAIVAVSFAGDFVDEGKGPG